MKRTILTGFALAAMLALIVYRVMADEKPATAPSAPAGIKILADFENDGDAKLVKGGDDFVTVAIVDGHATSGSKSLKVTSTKGNDYCPIDVVGAAVKGWEPDKYKYIAADFTTDQDVNCSTIVEALDAKSTNHATRASIEDDATPHLKKGKVTIFVPLADFKRNDKSGPLDMTQITKIRFIIETKDLKDDLVTYIDNIRLTANEPK